MYRNLSADRKIVYLIVISASILFGCLFWVADSLYEYIRFQDNLRFMLFQEPLTIFDSLLFNIPSHALFNRLSFMIACFAGGLLVSTFLYKQRDSEERLSQIVKGSSTPMFVIDKKHTVTHWNKACENLTGFSASEIVGTKRQWAPFYSTERPVLADVIVDNLTEEETAKYYDGKYQKSVLIEGAYEVEDFFPTFGDKWLFFTAAPLRDQQGKVVGAVESFRDITRRRLAEEVLRKAHYELETRVEERTSELQAINRELEAFSYSVSHDLRAPLRAIDGFSQILLEDYVDALDKQARHYLKRVRAGTQNMGRLIDDLLNLSRIGRQPMEKKTVNVETVAREAYETLEDEWKERKVNLTFYQCPSVLADANLMQIVFVNLLSNALKFTRSRATAEIEVGSETKDNETVLLVKDNGVGFDMKYTDKLFTTFQRLHRAEEYEGAGVGLAIVQRIIHRHGGRIWAESEVGVGTSFWFTMTA